jgi:hypothetical protein
MTTYEFRRQRGISTDINTGPEFGHAFSDYPNNPRLIQLAAKFYF